MSRGIGILPLHHLTASTKPTCDAGRRASLAQELASETIDSLAEPSEGVWKPRLKHGHDPAFDHGLASYAVCRTCHSHTEVEDRSVSDTIWLATHLRTGPDLV